MEKNYILLFVGALIGIELLFGISYCAVKNRSYWSEFLSRPFGIPMPSMALGIVMRALFIAVGTIAIVKFFV